MPCPGVIGLRACVRACVRAWLYTHSGDVRQDQAEDSRDVLDRRSIGNPEINPVRPILYKQWLPGAIPTPIPFVVPSLFQCLFPPVLRPVLVPVGASSAGWHHFPSAKCPSSEMTSELITNTSRPIRMFGIVLDRRLFIPLFVCLFGCLSVSVCLFVCLCLLTNVCTYACMCISRCVCVRVFLSEISEAYRSCIYKHTDKSSGTDFFYIYIYIYIYI